MSGQYVGNPLLAKPFPIAAIGVMAIGNQSPKPMGGPTSRPSPSPFALLRSLSWRGGVAARSRSESGGRATDEIDLLEAAGYVGGVGVVIVGHHEADRAGAVIPAACGKTHNPSAFMAASNVQTLPARTGEPLPCAIRLSGTNQSVFP